MSCNCRAGYICNSCRVHKAICTVTPARTFVKDYSAKKSIDELTKLIVELTDKANKNEKDILEIKNEEGYCGITQVNETVNLGDWDTAIATFKLGSDVCVAKGLTPDVEKRIPAKKGDTVQHNGDVWISLVDDNTTEPTLETQLSGKWLNLNTINSAINMIYDYHKDITLENDPVVSGNVLFDRLNALEARVTALENP